jgi:hypothetical protein
LQSTPRNLRQVENAVALESLDNHQKAEVLGWQGLGIKGWKVGTEFQDHYERKNKAADGSHLGKFLTT